MCIGHKKCAGVSEIFLGCMSFFFYSFNPENLCVYIDKSITKVLWFSDLSRFVPKSLVSSSLVSSILVLKILVPCGLLLHNWVSGYPDIHSGLISNDLEGKSLVSSSLASQSLLKAGCPWCQVKCQKTNAPM